MKKFLVLVISLILVGCFGITDEYTVVDKQIQSPINVFETSDEYPQGYIKQIPRLYIITIVNHSTNERESFVVDKTEYFKFELGTPVLYDSISKWRKENKK